MNPATLLRDSLRDLSEFCSKGCRVKLGEDAAKALVDMLSDVEDCRVKGKVKHSLPELLATCIWVALRGRFTSFLGLETHVREHAAEFSRLGLLRGGAIPSHDTYRAVFCGLKADSLRDSFMPKFEAAIERILGFNPGWRSKTEIIGVDGKTFNGSGRKGRLRNANVLNFYKASSGLCVSSTPLADKESEIKAAQDQLRRRKLAGSIVTADALHCQRLTCGIIASRGGGYLITAKGNQPELQKEIEMLFAAAGDSLQVLRHNGAEYSAIAVGPHNSALGWPGCKAYARMVSHKRIGCADYNPAPQYFVSSTDNLQLIAEAADNRWQIEDGLHLFKDSFTQEDKCAFTNKGAIKTMAVVNNIVHAFYLFGAAIAGKDLRSAKEAWRDNPGKLLGIVLPLLRRTGEFRRIASRRARGGA